LVDMESVQTNIVIFELKGEELRGEELRGGDSAAVVGKLKEEGVLSSAIGPHVVRLVTHFDVGRDDCVRAAEILKRVLAA
jgi:threonine aldolase